MSEAATHFAQGVQLLQTGQYAVAAKEFTMSAELFAGVGELGQAAHAAMFAGGAYHKAGEYQEGQRWFAVAQGYLDQVAARDGRLGDHLDELLLRLQMGWLESLSELAEQRQPDDPIVTDAVQRCDRVLALTQQPIGPLAVHARFSACGTRARLLARRGDEIAALPSAREAAETASTGRGPEARSLERYMRTIIATALMQLSEENRDELAQLREQTEAADEFVRAARLAIPDGDTLTIEMALLGLGMLRPRRPERLAIGLQDLPAALAAADMRHFEARCRVILATAMERVSSGHRPQA